MRQYGKIESFFWQNPKTQRLSDRGKILLLYLFSCPHGNSIGLFVLRRGYIMEDLGWQPESVTAAVAEIVDAGFVERDESTGLTRICGWFDHNTLENDNVAQRAVKTFHSLPHVDVIVSNYINELNTLPNVSGNRHIITFLNAITTASEDPSGNSFHILNQNLNQNQNQNLSQTGQATVSPTHADVKNVVELWNEKAKESNLPKVDKLTDGRRRAVLARWRDALGFEGFAALFERVAASSFLRGERNGSGHENFRADFDWVLKEANFVKIREGRYDDRKPQLVAERDPWRGRLIAFAKHGTWLEDWGIKPGAPGCLAPKDLIAEIVPASMLAGAA